MLVMRRDVTRVPEALTFITQGMTIEMWAAVTASPWEFIGKASDDFQMGDSGGQG